MATFRRRLLFQLVTNQRLEQQVRRSPTLERRAYARVVQGEEADQRQEEVRGVQGRAAEGLGEGAGSGVDAGLLDPAADGPAQGGPAVQVGGQAEGAGQADGVVRP
jgi:hypothetical protein